MDYVKDKQRKLQEIYQANEIIYEEEDSPNGGESMSPSSSNSLSRKPPTLSNHSVSLFHQSHSQKEQLLKQIDHLFQKKYESDMAHLRGKINCMEG